MDRLYRAITWCSACSRILGGPLKKTQSLQVTVSTPLEVAYATQSGIRHLKLHEVAWSGKSTTFARSLWFKPLTPVQSFRVLHLRQSLLPPGLMEEGEAPPGGQSQRGTMGSQFFLNQWYIYIHIYIYIYTYIYIYIYIHTYIYAYVRRKFRGQTSDNMDRWKAEQGRGREKRKIRREKIRRERVRRKKMQMREKVGKSRNTVFPIIWGSGGSKSRLAKAAGADPAGHRSDAKLHAVVARSTFPSRNVQNTSASDHFWKLMSKKCTPLWCEAHVQVKMYATNQVRTTFGSPDVEKVHAVVARSTFPSQNVQNTPLSDHFWRFRCRKSVEKEHAVVVRSTCRSQKCKKLRVLSLFWREDVEKLGTD